MRPVIKKNLSDQVKEYLYTYIKEMDASVSCKLPPEIVIAERFSVSRVTVRRALDDLENEGYIIRIHGKGTFINDKVKQLKLNLSQGCDFFKIINKSGYEATVEFISDEVIVCEKELAEKLGVEVGERAVNVEKIFYANGNPAIICIDIIPLKNIGFIELDEGNIKKSPFELCRTYGGKMCIRDKIEIYTMSNAQMKLHTKSSSKLNCKSALVFDVINYDEENKPLFCDMEFYNTDYIRFHLIRGKDVY